MQPPIKCTSTRVTIGDKRYKIYSNGSVCETMTKEEIQAAIQTAVSNSSEFTYGQLLDYESKQVLHDPHSDLAKSVRKEVQRQRRNKKARERNQALRDIGMRKTAYGWE